MGALGLLGLAALAPAVMLRRGSPASHPPAGPWGSRDLPNSSPARLGARRGLASDSGRCWGHRKPAALSSARQIRRPGCTLPFDKHTLAAPVGVRFEEHTIVAPGDVIVGDGCTLGFGLQTPGRVFVGEKAEVQGDIEAGGDVRVDHFSVVKGSVRSGGGAYLGERVRVEGALKAQDLDVGDSVEILGGWEARGWVSIRNPVPVVMYLFIYLLQLLGQGRSEEVERILRELEGGGDEPIVVGPGFLYVPAGSRLGLQEGVVRGNLSVGQEARVLGNFDVQGWARLEKGAQLVGALRAAGDIHVAEQCSVEGDLECHGTLHLGAGARVAGSIEARKVSMAQSARIEGTVQAREGIAFLSPGSEAMAQKVEDLRAGRLEVQGMLR